MRQFFKNLSVYFIILVFISYIFVSITTLALGILHIPECYEHRTKIYSIFPTFALGCWITSYKEPKCREDR